jgi:RNAse (barnase) inhibitor barstar
MSNIKITSTNYFKVNNERIVFIDGNTCDTIDKCYTTLQQQLSIPDYFGNNLDALEEVLADIEWIEEEKVQLVILNETGLLKNDILRKDVFMDILKNNGNNKLTVTIVG